MPIRRFAHALEREGRTEAYMDLLANHFNPATVPGLMCRSLLSVDYYGRLYDCDFNLERFPRPDSPAQLGSEPVGATPALHVDAAAVVTARQELT